MSKGDRDLTSIRRGMGEMGPYLNTLTRGSSPAVAVSIDTRPTEQRVKLTVATWPLGGCSTSSIGD